ncbi:hypothetical protein J4558_19220 [Leptolyngbya sp. 15MV]|nr:hypothetical protein J4558_19220 [Leptolyngbya sp. 15MV]
MSASSFVSNSTACGVTSVVLMGSTAVNTVFRANQAALCPAVPSSNVAIQGGTLINCLVLGNTTGSSALTVSGGVLVNSIVWDNCSPSLGTCGKAQVAPTADVRYSAVQNWTGTTQFGNSSADPLVDPNTLQLLPGSPAIDAGDTLAVPPGVQTDQIGQWRFIAGGGSPLGAGPAPRVDRGPLEFGDAPAYCYANIDQSTGVPALTPSDFVAFLGLYRAGHPVANCDGSALTPVLTPADFVCFVSRYRAGCP